MNITIFAQILQRLPKNIFHELVKKYQTDKHSKGIDSWIHLVSMLFCQFSKSNSLILMHHWKREKGFRTQKQLLQHLIILIVLIGLVGCIDSENSKTTEQTLQESPEMLLAKATNPSNMLSSEMVTGGLIPSNSKMIEFRNGKETILL